MNRLIINLIKCYQKYLRGFHNRSCIYTPTCSEYAVESLDKYGISKGIFFSYRRIRRCNGALFAGGEDRP